MHKIFRLLSLMPSNNTMLNISAQRKLTVHHAIHHPGCVYSINEANTRNGLIYFYMYIFVYKQHNNYMYVKPPIVSSRHILDGEGGIFLNTSKLFSIQSILVLSFENRELVLLALATLHRLQLRITLVQWTYCEYIHALAIKIAHKRMTVTFQHSNIVVCRDGQPRRLHIRMPVMQPDSWLHNRTFGWLILYRLVM